jgi:hypothetical protein
MAIVTGGVLAERIAVHKMSSSRTRGRLIYAGMLQCLIMNHHVISSGIIQWFSLPPISLSAEATHDLYPVFHYK